MVEHVFGRDGEYQGMWVVLGVVVNRFGTEVRKGDFVEKSLGTSDLQKAEFNTSLKQGFGEGKQVSVLGLCIKKLNIDIYLYLKN